MARHERFEDAISGWLEETAPTRLPERVLDATFERTRRTRQEVGWRATLGRRQMSRFAYPLGGVAVIAVAAVIASALLRAPSSQDGVGGQTTPPPTVSPSPTVSPTPVLGPLSECVDFSTVGGTYRATAGAVPVKATVPAGWHGERDSFSLVNAPCIFGGSVTLDVSPVSHVYTNACDWFGTDVKVDTAAAASAAFAAQEGHQTTGPTDVTVASYPASRFEFSVPAGFDAGSRCSEGNGNGSIALWRSPELAGAGQGIDPGETMTVYVVDVDGSTLAVAATRSSDDATAADVAELDAIVASLQFEP